MKASILLNQCDKIIDVEIDKETAYLTVGKTPLEKVYKLLSKFDSIRWNKELGLLL